MTRNLRAVAIQPNSRHNKNISSSNNNRNKHNRNSTKSNKQQQERHQLQQQAMKAVNDKLAEAASLEQKLNAPSSSQNSNSQSTRENEQERSRICQIFSDILCDHALLAHEHDIASRLWRTCFYSQINQMRSRISREVRRMMKNSSNVESAEPNKAKAEHEAALVSLLAEAVQLYEYIIKRYEDQMIPSLSRSTEPNRSSSTVQTPAEVSNLHRFLIHLGDLHRYDPHASSSSSLTLAADVYSRAQLLVPGDGNAYNQQAVIAQNSSQVVVSLYWYVRALGATQVPFVTSKSNIARLLGSNRRKIDGSSVNAEIVDIVGDGSGNGSVVNNQQKGAISKRFAMEYVHLVALCLGATAPSSAANSHCIDAHKQADWVIKVLTWLLSAGRVGDQLLYKLVCINVYMVATEQQRAPQEQSKQMSERGPKNVNPASSKDGIVCVSQEFTLRFACVLAEHAISYLDVMAAKDHSTSGNVRALGPFLLLCEWWVLVQRSRKSSTQINSSNSLTTRFYEEFCNVTNAILGVYSLDGTVDDEDGNHCALLETPDYIHMRGFSSFKSFIPCVSYYASKTDDSEDDEEGKPGNGVNIGKKSCATMNISETITVDRDTKFRMDRLLHLAELLSISSASQIRVIESTLQVAVDGKKTVMYSACLPGSQNSATGREPVAPVASITSNDMDLEINSKSGVHNNRNNDVDMLDDDGLDHTQAPSMLFQLKPLLPASPSPPHALLNPSTDNTDVIAVGCDDDDDAEDEIVYQAPSNVPTPPHVGIIQCDGSNIDIKSSLLQVPLPQSRFDHDRASNLVASHSDSAADSNMPARSCKPPPGFGHAPPTGAVSLGGRQVMSQPPLPAPPGFGRVIPSSESDFIGGSGNNNSSTESLMNVPGLLQPMNATSVIPTQNPFAVSSLVGDLLCPAPMSQFQDRLNDATGTVGSASVDDLGFTFNNETLGQRFIPKGLSAAASMSVPPFLQDVQTSFASLPQSQKQNLSSSSLASADLSSYLFDYGISSRSTSNGLLSSSHEVPYGLPVASNQQPHRLLFEPAAPKDAIRTSTPLQRHQPTSVPHNGLDGVALAQQKEQWNLWGEVSRTSDNTTSMSSNQHAASVRNTAAVPAGCEISTSNPFFY
eukprot:CAMPEP_0194367098 /NCGR_PEP_ID=MMETSP0174-20130528/15190_1 /TAXON_ID=216777 /ORGANISM="Proboscia alata, Strain PI-D3" /LENGTH=1120 /DNA_ID=CAMNT_0039142671 /DNA_START=445 /DNA_END=3807 /DNA_ORIENTATION=+